MSLTQTAYAQLSGLSVTNTFNQVTVDIRGNETRTFGNDTQRTTQVPSCSNPQIERYAFGQLVETVDTACVTMPTMPKETSCQSPMPSAPLRPTVMT